MKQISDEDFEQLKDDFKFIISNSTFRAHVFSESMKRFERMTQILGKLTSQEEKPTND